MRVCYNRCNKVCNRINYQQVNIYGFRELTIPRWHENLENRNPIEAIASNIPVVMIETLKCSDSLPCCLKD